VDWKEDDYVGWSPNEEAGNIEGKPMSVLWDLSESEWNDEIVPLMAKLRALPDPDHPRRVHGKDAVVVFSAR
jgi:hypothetical protein